MKKLICYSLMLLPLMCAAQAQSVSGALPAGAVASTSSTAQISLPARMPETSLDQVHDRLKLTELQQPYWVNYVARLDDFTMLHYQEKPVTAFAGDAAPRQVGRLVDSLQNRLAVLEEVEGAAKALYAVLDPTQKKLADQVLISTMPVFASSAGADCPAPRDIKPRSDKAEAGQHKRRGGGMGGMGGMGQ